MSIINPTGKSEFELVKRMIEEGVLKGEAKEIAEAMLAMFKGLEEAVKSILGGFYNSAKRLVKVSGFKYHPELGELEIRVKPKQDALKKILDNILRAKKET